jgi:putative ABC transport system permease protein
VDGTFPLGAAVTAVCIMSGMHPLLAILIAMAAGVAAGFVTGALHVYLKITNLLCGILTMIALYSVNLHIMGNKSNIPLFNVESVFTPAIPKVVVALLFVAVIKLLLDLYMKTFAGKSLLAVGVNEQLVKTLSINTGRLKITGLMIANGLAALSGSLMAQYQNFADAGMGSGTVVIGLASVIIGRAVFGKVRWLQGSTSVIIGSIIYKLAIGAALKLGLPSIDMKLMTAVFFVLVIILQGEGWRKKVAGMFTKGGRRDA